MNWIVDADIAGFFDAVSHEWLMRFVEHRIGDRRINRLIRKWLKAGVMEEGELVPSEAGTPQGAVASPLLANIYLHYVFDLWADRWRKRRARGHVIIVRYADDSVPRARRVERTQQCATAQPMRGGPSEPACRSRFQTAFGGYDQKSWS